jgi:protein-L-isoaspartate(D-aspartate) O-methyltransferase
MSDFATRRKVMVDTQVRPSDVTKFPIIDAMLSVPRENFVPRDKREVAYIGENVSLGNGRVVLEPRTLAKFLDALDLSKDELVLDIGSGLGYSSALISLLAEAVVALEEDPDWVGESEEAFQEFGVDNILVHAGLLCEGAAKHGPYDVIFIQGAVEQVPQQIIDQLKDGGRLACIFADGALGRAKIAYKLDGRMNWRFAFNAGAPLLGGFEKHREFVL